MHVHIITTGGTIDKEYFDARSEYEVGMPQIEAILQATGVSFSYVSEVLMRKDSLDLTDADRRRIAERVQTAEVDRVLITHGTDTMVETGRVIAETLGADSTKTVVLVGSLTPARFKASDAEFNIGFAAAAVQTLPPGVYIAMNGCVFDPLAARKNQDENRFEHTNNVTPAL